MPPRLLEARALEPLPPPKALDERGVYAAGFFYPVVPEGRARIRTQMSSELTDADIDFAVAAFTDAGKSIRLI